MATVAFTGLEDTKRHAVVRNALVSGEYGTIPLPELVVDIILDYAAFWDWMSTESNVEKKIRDARDAYLTLTIPDAQPRMKLRKLRVECESHDQGWSSYPANQGTYKGSWTWGDLSVVDETGTTLVKIDRVYTNIHACGDYQSHKFEVSCDHALLRELTPGRRLILSLNARFPGWTNYVRFARMTLFHV